MADTSVVAGPARTDGSIPYEIGKVNWKDRTIPDIRNPSAQVQIEENRLIDVVILGDGFTCQEDFESLLAGWIDSFYDLKVYDLFRGVFRIRALYRESPEYASKDRNSYYRVKVDNDGIRVSGGSWWRGDTGAALAFRERLFADVDSFPGINLRRYPDGLSFDEGNTAIGDWVFGMYRNLVVCMLVKTEKRNNASGWALRVTRPSPDNDKMVRVAVGANAIHEFSHAFGLLSDEYIKERETVSSRVNPRRENILNCSNLSFSSKYSEVPWLHLSPWGRISRQAAGNEASPVLGWLWVGGNRHRGVWHAEYRCLMNGRSNNFQFTQDAASDPTAQPDGVYQNDKGADLRDKSRFCLWCQELVCMRILERTDQLQEPTDPADFVERGQIWYARWKSELRDNYWSLFGVSEQIRDYEAAYAGMRVGPAGEALEMSDLYAPFDADTHTHAHTHTHTHTHSPGLDAGMWLVLLA
ncbi:MAG TPA: hypothetical protein ENJ80_02240 [Gammaproteobacteria bacterium]|nr:hypothetical protein [Gammaproteobacteria bacterium]